MKRLLSILLCIQTITLLGSVIGPVGPDLASVQTEVAIAVDGDTVKVASGSSTWSGTLNITNGVTVAGAASWGGGTTTIMDGNTSGNMITMNQPAGKLATVSGFTFSAPSINGNVISGNGTFRACSNSVTLGDAGAFVWVNDSDYSSSLVDRNTFTGGTAGHFVVVGGSAMQGGSFGRWTNGVSTYGTTNGCYVEHNTVSFSGSTLGDGAFDAYNGAEWVVRYNTLNNEYIGQHGCDSGQHLSPHRWEFYGNTFNWSMDNQSAMQSRGGAGLIFSNTINGFSHVSTGYNYGIALQNYRQIGSVCQQTGNCPPWNYMTGSNPYDGNLITTGSAEGWPGYCQVGMSGPTAGYAVSGSGTKTTQAFSPVYIWKNYGDGGSGLLTTTNQGVGPWDSVIYGTNWTDSALAGYTPMVDPHPLANYTNSPASQRVASVPPIFRIIAQ